MNDWLSEVNRYASEGTSKLLIGETERGEGWTYLAFDFSDESIVRKI